MKKGLTELVFILDRSGSMLGLEKDTIGGFNAMLQKQKGINGECYITTILFDNNYEILHDRIDMRAVKNITDKESYVCGSTALVDAIGKTINKIINVQKNTSEEYCAEKVVFVIITDGEENSSHQYTAKQVKNQIEQQKTKYGWEFIFLGANIDAVETAAQFGIAEDRAVDYISDSRGTQLNFKVMSEAIECVRKGELLEAECFMEIKADLKNRKS